MLLSVRDTNWKKITACPEETEFTMEDTIDIPQDARQEVRIPATSLKKLIAEILVHKSMFQVEAEIVADRLVEADLRGIHSHGSRRLKNYLEAIDDGHIDPRATSITLNETPAIAVLDAGKGIGHVVSTRAMQMAIEKAKQVGTGTVAVLRSQHFGAASVYVLLAANQGLIGYCTTSTGPATVAAYNSCEAATANNAFAWGVPIREGPHFVLDMACAVSSWGKVESLKMYGQSLPEGWAMDADGNPTLDPVAAKTLLPASGARGFGLALLSSVLAGSLVGRRMPLHKPRDPFLEGSEHFFYAIDPAQFGEPDRFYDELEATVAGIRALQAVDGADKVRIPGELESERAERWQAAGIPMHRDHVKSLEQLATLAQINLPW